MRQREEEQQLNTLLLFLYKFVLFQREGAAETGKWCNPVISRDGFSLVRQLGFSFYCCRPFFVFVFLDVHLSRSREHSVIPWQGIPWFRPWWYTESLLFSENDRIHSPPRILRTRECVGVSLECIREYYFQGYGVRAFSPLRRNVRAPTKFNFPSMLLFE